MNTSLARYLLGVAALAVILAALALAAIALRRRFFPGWLGAPARLAELTIALTTLITTSELLGAVGLFSLAPIVAALVLVAGVAVTTAGVGRGGARRVAWRPDSADTDRTTTSQITTVLSLIGAATVVALWASPMLQSYDVGIHTFDSLYYHLPWAATFARTGRVTALQYDIQYMLQFYPASAELLHGLGILLLTRDTLSPALNFLWLGMTLLAAWCIGRPRGVAPVTMLAAAVAMATPMIVFSQAGSADNDVAGVAALLAAIGLLAGGEELPAATVLGGVAAGMAIGIKLTLFGPVIALSAAVIAIAPRGRRGRTAVLWLGPLLLAGCFWYLRNLISVGNPLPWVSFGFLPTPAPALAQHTGYSVFHYLTDGRFWSHFFVSGIASQLGGWWWALVGAAIIGPLLCLLPGAGRTRRMLGLVALASLVAYLLTPESAQGPVGDPVGFAFNMRYLAPGLTLALVVGPLAPVFGTPRRQLALTVALVTVLIATCAKPSLWPHAHALGAVAIGLVGLALVLALALRPRVLGGRAGRLVLAVAAALALTAGAAAGYGWQRHYLRGRYEFRRGVSYLAHVWARFRLVRHARVGVVGTYGGFFSYPLFGSDLSNTVQYIANHGPHGSFTPIASCQAFRAAVNAGHYQYLVSTPGRVFWRPKVLSTSPETSWTGSDPNAQLLYRRRALGQPISVFGLRGPLNPAACPSG